MSWLSCYFVFSVCSEKCCRRQGLKQPSNNFYAGSLSITKSNKIEILCQLSKTHVIMSKFGFNFLEFRLAWNLIS